MGEEKEECKRGRTLKKNWKRKRNSENKGELKK
jgi:hypothetical protein